MYFSKMTIKTLKEALLTLQRDFLNVVKFDVLFKNGIKGGYLLLHG